MYVLTSSGADVYADMTLVSMLSARLTNPSIPLRIVCDIETSNALARVKSRVLDYCDEIISVDAPDGSPVYRNRWIKTQLDLFATDNVLFLDSDTIVRRSLIGISDISADFGAVANHNGSVLSEQMWEEDREHIETMGWSSRFETYFNGGVWLFKPTAKVRNFFNAWHSGWLAGARKTGRLLDQPSLNIAIRDSDLGNCELPEQFNKQLYSSWENSQNALIWHFYTPEHRESHRYAELIPAIPAMNTRKVKAAVRRLLEMPAPWSLDNIFGQRLSKRFDDQSSLPDPVMHLLSRRYSIAGKLYVKQILRRLGIQVIS